MAADRHHVYFVALDNVLRALDRGHGQPGWKAPLPHRPTGGVFLAARLLLVPGIAGEVAAFQTVDGSTTGVSTLAGDPVAAPQLRVSPTGALEGVFVVSGDGQAQRLVPGPPPLPAKAIPGLPMGLPEIKGALSKGQPESAPSDAPAPRARPAPAGSRPRRSSPSTAARTTAAGCSSPLPSTKNALPAT